MAVALIDARRGREALEVISAAAVSETDPEARVIRGRAYLQMNDLSRAQAEFLSAAKMAPQLAVPYRWLGEVLMRRGDPHRAVKVLTRAEQIDPSDADVQRIKSRAERLVRVADGASAHNLIAPLSEDAEELAPTGEVTAVRPEPVPEAGAAAAEPNEGAADFEVEESTRVDDDEPTSFMPRDALNASLLQTRHARPSKTKARASEVSDTEISLPGRVAPPSKGPTSKPAVKDLLVEDSRPPSEAPTPLAVEIAGPNLMPQYAPPGAHEAPTSEALVPRNHAATLSPGDEVPRSPSEALAEGLSPAALAPPDDGPWDDMAADFDEAPPPAAMGAGRVDPMASTVGRDERDVTDQDDPVEGEAFPGRREAIGGSTMQDPPLGSLHTAAVDGAAVAVEGATAPRRSRRALGVLKMVIALALLAGMAGGGFYGFHAYKREQQATREGLLESARKSMWRGAHRDFVSAERDLLLARDQFPERYESLAWLIALQAQKALEDGAFEPGYLKSALGRAEALKGQSVPDVLPEFEQLGQALVDLAEGRIGPAREAVTSTLERPQTSPFGLYLGARLLERLGEADATEQLRRAMEADEALMGPRVAMAEAALAHGDRDGALKLLDGVLVRHPDHARARLLAAYVKAATEPPEGQLAEVDAIATDLDEPVPADRLLVALAKTRLFARLGERDKAFDALGRAADTGATAPRLLAMLAREAMALGRLKSAEQAASLAASATPEHLGHRLLLAEVHLVQFDGRGALRALAEVSLEDPEVLSVVGRAALFGGDSETLVRVDDALATLSERGASLTPELSALRLRVQLRLGRGRSAFKDAKQLATKSPDVPMVAVALGEAALEVGEATVAEEVLTRLVTKDGDHAEGLYLLARAKRALSAIQETESLLRRIIEIRPAFMEAHLALGSLLLDAGRYADADAVYTALLEGRDTSVEPPFDVYRGRVEALLGEGKVEEAVALWEATPEPLREGDVALMTRARVALASDKAAQAVQILSPPASREEASAELLVLLGDALFSMGRVDRANGAYLRALAVDPELPEALLGRAEVALRAEKPKDAQPVLDVADDVLKRLLRPEGFRARHYSLRGRAYLMAGDRAAARDALRRAIELRDVPADTYFFLGETLAGRRPAEARTAYEKYLSIAPTGPYARRAQRAIQ